MLQRPGGQFRLELRRSLPQAQDQIVGVGPPVSDVHYCGVAADDHGLQRLLPGCIDDQAGVAVAPAMEWVA